MTDTVTALRVALDGKVTEYTLGDTRSEQATTLARALTDAPEAIAYLDRPGHTSIVVLAGLHRARHLPNLFAEIIQTEIAREAVPVQGPAVFTGVTHDGQFTALPLEAAAAIRNLCPDNPDGIPVLISFPF
ncbi:hypothetical protein ACFYVL_17315 [Streptomyces sp. NPDC004111]|uniref:hypothetical protein n=1 Tax=Streptomyces sp. NPDC004111 TaxID=3364690 RepID=UPI0036C3970E